MNDIKLFSYRPGNSVFHRIPSWLKIIFIPLFNVLLFVLNWKFAAAFIVIFAVTFALMDFSFSEQISDLRPVLYYAVFLYFMNLFMEIYGAVNGSGADVSASGAGTVQAIFQLIKTCIFNAVTNRETAFFCIKFCACVQSCSLMFKTSTSIQIRTGIEQIECCLRRFIPFAKKEPVFALAVSMLINFIPAVFKIWNQLCRAWLCRGGKTGVKMFMTLIPQLFSLGLKFSLDSAKALINRGQK